MLFQEINRACCVFVSEVCSAPIVTNGKIAGEQKDIYQSGDQITIACNAGYGTFRPNTCQRTRAWLPNPDCRFMFCNDTRDVNHSSINEFPTLGNGENGTVSFHSERFYLKSGSVEVTCLSSRKLSWLNVPEFGKIIFNLPYVLLFILYSANNKN